MEGVLANGNSGPPTSRAYSVTGLPAPGTAATRTVEGSPSSPSGGAASASSSPSSGVEPLFFGPVRRLYEVLSSPGAFWTYGALAGGAEGLQWSRQLSSSSGWGVLVVLLFRGRSTANQ